MKQSLDGGNTNVIVIGNNFYNSFSGSPTAIKARIGSVILNATIDSPTQISVQLPSGTSFAYGSNSFSISLNDGSTWTTDPIVIGFYPTCPGSGFLSFFFFKNNNKIP